MCTVTYIPIPGGALLTSNRDERKQRLAAHLPMIGEHASGLMLYPRDGNAGGTWIAVHQKGHAIVFLNGAFQPHVPDPPYRRSRGLILLELADDADPVERFKRIQLDRIEPFTAIILAQDALCVCRWDGQTRHIEKPDKDTPHIWSSVTLYGPPAISQREQWFRDFLKECPAPELEDVLNFHSSAGDGDPHNSVRMDRDGEVSTVSITAVAIRHRYAQMVYLAQPIGTRSAYEIPFEPTTVPS